LFPEEIDTPPSVELTPAEAQVDCALPPDWTTYIVQPGDTLFGIAQATGSSLNDLLIVNCIESENEVRDGSVLFVPRPPVFLVPTVAPTNALIPFNDLRLVGCDQPGAQIISPTAGQEVGGIFDVYGNASIPNFTVYLIEVRPASARNYTVYSFSQSPVTAGSLGTINTRFFGSGLHFIRLAVADTSGVPLTCVVPVVFR
jgi:LysM repeat protein